MTGTISVRSITLVGLTAAVLCILGPVTVLLPLSPVPLSLSTLALYLSVYLVGTKRALAACGTYLLIGLVGLPVFSGFSGGLAKLAGPTGGYLLGYLPLTLICGLAIERFAGTRSLQIAGMALGTVCLYALGTAWMACLTGAGFVKALGMGAIPFLPGDALKIAAAAAIGPILRNRLERAGAV